eukprot:803147_1
MFFVRSSCCAWRRHSLRSLAARLWDKSFGSSPVDPLLILYMRIIQNNNRPTNLISEIENMQLFDVVNTVQEEKQQQGLLDNEEDEETMDTTMFDAMDGMVDDIADELLSDSDYEELN